MTPNQEGYFVDWISISQYHGEGLPELFGELRLVYDKDGEPDHESAKSLQVRGSYDSSLHIRSHQGWVSVSGNPSRWGRSDNLFGLSLDECIQVLNDELARHGLPGFDAGRRMHTETADDIRADRMAQWTGARISRIDITRNYVAGSEWLARLAMRAYAQKGRARMKRAVYGDETSMWHTGRRCVKAYLKGPEMTLHAKHSPWTAWAIENGVVRHELELRSKLLSETRLCYLGNLTMGQLIQLHRRETAHLLDIDATLDPMAVEHIPAKSRLIYAAWLKGEPVRELLTRPTFYRHRKTIMDAAGVDIGEQRSTVSKVIELPQRTVTLAPAVAPDGYWLMVA